MPNVERGGLYIFTWPCIARYWMLRDAVIGVRKSAIVLVRIYQDSTRLDGWYSIEYPTLHMGNYECNFYFWHHASRHWRDHYGFSKKSQTIEFGVLGNNKERVFQGLFWTPSSSHFFVDRF